MEIEHSLGTNYIQIWPQSFQFSIIVSCKESPLSFYLRTSKYTQTTYMYLAYVLGHENALLLYIKGNKKHR